jgi:hypothetical protein
VTSLFFMSLSFSNKMNFGPGPKQKPAANRASNPAAATMLPNFRTPSTPQKKLTGSPPLSGAGPPTTSSFGRLRCFYLPSRASAQRDEGPLHLPLAVDRSETRKLSPTSLFQHPENHHRCSGAKVNLPIADHGRDEMAAKAREVIPPSRGLVRIVELGRQIRGVVSE